MSKVLVIPGAFVPTNDTVTLLCYKHLRLLDHQYDVLALKDKFDKSLIKQLENDDNFAKFNLEYCGNYSDIVMNMQNKNIFKGIFNMFLYLKTCFKKAKENQYAILYTSSIPCFTHLAGYLIKKKYPQIKWVASFSDPIYKSPYKKDPETFKNYNLLEKIGFYVYIWIYMNSIFEKTAMKYADQIIMISEQQKAYMCQNYQQDYREKCHVVPLNYIEAWQKDIKHDNKHLQPYQAVHMGRIYGLRKINNFLEALKQLKEELKTKVIFHQYGEIPRNDLKKIKEYGLEDIFIVHDKVSYDQAQEIQLKGDILLLFDTIMQGDNQPYLPSKITEYMLTNKPILATCKANSPSYELLKQDNYVGNEIEEIKTNLKHIISNYHLVENKGKVIKNQDLKTLLEEII